jgi:predicted ATPase
MLNPKTYIITGAPGTGKSTIIDALRQTGHVCFDEIARKIIAQELRQGTNRLPWMDIRSFSEMVLEDMLSQKPEVLNEPLSFLDRGIPDIIGYFNYAKITPATHYFDALKDYPYQNKVFFTPLWEEIYVTDSERLETTYEAKKISEALFNTYTSLGFNVVEIPKASIKQRLKFILENI